MWKLMDLPSHKLAIIAKWIYKLKRVKDKKNEQVQR